MVKYDYQLATQDIDGRPITMKMQSSVAEVAEGCMWIINDVITSKADGRRRVGGHTIDISQGKPPPRPSLCSTNDSGLLTSCPRLLKTKRF